LSLAGAFPAAAQGSTGTGFSMLNRLHLLGRRLCAPLWATLALAGCATLPEVTPPPPAPAPARLAVVNLTPHVWRIGVSATVGGEPRVVQVGEHATVELELPGGDYRIEQTLLAASGQSGATRTFPATFEAGQAYRWPLATLGSMKDEIQSGGDGR
jgi:hypothetical protein